MWAKKIREDKMKMKMKMKMMDDGSDGRRRRPDWVWTGLPRRLRLLALLTGG
jgi:hypothetical protein